MLRPRTAIIAFLAVILVGHPVLSQDPPAEAAPGLAPAAAALLARAPWQGLGLEAVLDEAATSASALPQETGDWPPALLRLSLVAGLLALEDEGTRLAAAVAAFGGQARLVVAVTENSPVDVRDGAAVDAWVERIATLVERTGRGVHAWEIGGEASRPAEEQAFFLKRTALAIKGVNRHALVLGADARAMPGGELFEDVAPFLDGHAAPPGPSIHGTVLRTGRRARSAAEAWEALVASREAGESAATVAIPAAVLQADPGGVAAVLRTAMEALPPDAAPTGGVPAVEFPAEARMRATELVVARDLSTRLLIRTELAGRLPAGAVLATFREEPADLRVFDPLAERTSRPRVTRRGSAWTAELPLAHRPLVVAWSRARSGEDVEEQVAVEAQEDPTVEEILARHFAVQAARDRRLQRYVADLSTEMRYELGASGQAFDVRVEGRYFHDAEGLREIENVRFFVNGARYDPKKGRPPEIPLLQPETVQVLPLEVRLDRSYEYRLVGRDTRAGRPAWKVSFRPTEGDSSAYAGTAWIDAETFDRLQVDLVQTGLEPPVLTNEQSDRFGPVRAGDGEHWLVQESRINRTISLLGGSVGVQMRMLFSNFRVNEGSFEQERAAALASPHQMLRDTDEGLKYLRPVEGGARELAETSSRRIFVAAGARYDDSYGGVLPLAGVNWLDYDLGGRGLQLNVFAAGAINSVSVANPSLFGSRVTLGVDAFLPVIRRRDRLAVPGSGVDDGETVRSRIPRIDVELSRPIGSHWRMALTAGIAHESRSEDDDTDDSFVVPADTWVGTLGGKLEMHRKGLVARAWIARSEREAWEPWGEDGGGGPPPLDGGDGYWKWGAGLARHWPLGRLQTVGLDARWVGGSGLDRFSQHEFSAFGGTRLPGFDGSGIHFDEAGLLRVSWGFDVGGVMGAEVQVGVGRTWNRQLPAAVEAAFGEDADHVGIALAGTLPGPWGTIVRFDVGTVLHSSDHEDAEGRLVAQAIVLKLLGK